METCFRVVFFLFRVSTCFFPHFHLFLFCLFVCLFFFLFFCFCFFYWHILEYIRSVRGGKLNIFETNFSFLFLLSLLSPFPPLPSLFFYIFWQWGREWHPTVWGPHSPMVIAQSSWLLHLTEWDEVSSQWTYNFNIS